MGDVSCQDKAEELIYGGKPLNIIYLKHSLRRRESVHRYLGLWSCFWGVIGCWISKVSLLGEEGHSCTRYSSGL